MNSSRAPLILAIVLLLLPVLYAGSYLVLVDPDNAISYKTVDGVRYPFIHNYRTGDEWAGRIFWPLEQIDRKVRPQRWEPLAPPQATRPCQLDWQDDEFERLNVRERISSRPLAGSSGRTESLSGYAPRADQTDSLAGQAGKGLLENVGASSLKNSLTRRTSRRGSEGRLAAHVWA